MKPLWLIILLTPCTYTTRITAETKKQKIEQLFSLTFDAKRLTKTVERILVQKNITNTTTQRNIVDKLLAFAREDYIAAYDKLFDEKHIDAMLLFRRSPTGKILETTRAERDAIFSKAASRIATILKRLPEEPAKQ